MKILNLYAGIGGNRKLWSDEHEITAIEYNQGIANIYKDYFPNDTIIVTDAHQYLLEHYAEYDFIWSSPPCPSHSRLNTFAVPNKTKKLEYPDMKLYEEILLLKHWCKGKWVVENVIPYYVPLIPAEKVDRHLFWTNFKIGGLNIKNPKLPHKQSELPYLQKFLGYDLSKYKVDNKKQILRNCVLPETGLHILNRALEIKSQEETEQKTLF